MLNLVIQSFSERVCYFSNVLHVFTEEEPILIYPLRVTETVEKPQSLIVYSRDQQKQVWV